MSAAMADRGPDFEGYLFSNDPEYAGSLMSGKDPAKTRVTSLQHRQHVGLAHRRLSITDLSIEASQPMSDSEGRYWIVFNGQIYNHPALRTELSKLGYRFKTDHSDTEVILNAYRHWGIDCLSRLNGTWAFCIWDSADNTVFMSRDKVGIRPLYYTIHDHAFFFASEMNAILENKDIPREISEFGIYDFLTYTSIPAPATIYKNIFKLPAAHYLFFKPGEPVSPKRYWDPVSSGQELRLSEAEVIGEVRDRLYASTERQMMADVNVGLLLSGGLDSSVLLACMQKHSPRPVNTYAVGFENNSLYKNEFEYSRKVAARFKSNHTELTISSNDFFDCLPHMAYKQDEPIADTANIPIYLISKKAHHDKVKVLLGGEGSDELFVGYQHWRLIYEFERLFRNRPRLAAGLAFIHRNSFFSHKRPYYQAWSNKLNQQTPAFWSGTELRAEEDKRRILSRDFLATVKGYNSFMPVRPLYDALLGTRPYDTFSWMTSVDLANRLPDLLLARMDRMAMSNSIEGRYPFLDAGLIEFVMKIPASLKVKGGTEKYLLKKAFEDVLPHDVIYRPKDSFTVPLNNLFGPGRKPQYLEKIRNFNKATGIFSEDYIIKLAAPENIKEFWNVLNLALWHEARA